MRYLKIINETFVDGPGVRMSIYVAGCNHKCPGCHNPETWNFDQGYLITPELVDEIIGKIKSNPLISGITFSGGDPLEKGNAEDLLWILEAIKSAGINVWVYTGYTYDQLLNDKFQKECLEYIDVLVDGPFIQEKKNPDLLYRGSENQRILFLNRGRIDHQYDEAHLKSDLSSWSLKIKV